MRDRALRRLKRITRTVVALSVAGAGLLAVLADRSAPGRRTSQVTLAVPSSTGTSDSVATTIAPTTVAPTTTGPSVVTAAPTTHTGAPSSTSAATAVHTLQPAGDIAADDASYPAGSAPCAHDPSACRQVRRVLIASQRSTFVTER